ncbi:hypothetical protein Droror1_Dr00008677, partial [Drosera rotundifolia]
MNANTEVLVRASSKSLRNDEIEASEGLMTMSCSGDGQGSDGNVKLKMDSRFLSSGWKKGKRSWADIVTK